VFDALNPVAEPDLLLSPGDEAEALGPCLWRLRCGRMEASMLFVVLHRRHGVWTHAYRVAADRRTGRRLVWLLRAVEGDGRDALRGWLRRHG
jgi:hypothetical protein